MNVAIPGQNVWWKTNGTSDGASVAEATTPATMLTRNPVVAPINAITPHPQV
jgi:hypothetical protein